MKRGRRAMVSPIDLVLSKIHQAKAYVLSDSVLCVGGSSMCDPSSKFEGRWVGSQFQRRRIKHFERHQRSILRVRFQRQSWYYLRRSNSIFRRLSTTSARNVFPRRTPSASSSWRKGASWRVTDKPHKNDDLRIQQAQEVCGYAERFQAGCWISVGPDSSNMQ